MSILQSKYAAIFPRPVIVKADGATMNAYCSAESKSICRDVNVGWSRDLGLEASDVYSSRQEYKLYIYMYKTYAYAVSKNNTRGHLYYTSKAELSSSRS